MVLKDLKDIFTKAPQLLDPSIAPPHRCSVRPLSPNATNATRRVAVRNVVKCNENTNRLFTKETNRKSWILNLLLLDLCHKTRHQTIKILVVSLQKFEGTQHCLKRSLKWIRFGFHTSYIKPPWSCCLMPSIKMDQSQWNRKLFSSVPRSKLQFLRLRLHLLKVKSVPSKRSIFAWHDAKLCTFFKPPNRRCVYECTNT